MTKRKHTLFLMLLSFTGWFSLNAQVNDLASKEDLLIEQTRINFDTFFFEALTQRAIGNYDKAVFALEECMHIDKTNTAVLFELSKNYFDLNKFTEAEYYGNQALNLQPDNIYLLKQLKEINLRQNDFEEAIRFQRMLIEKDSKFEPDLVYIFIRSGKIKEAKNLMEKLEKEERLPQPLQVLKSSLFQSSPQPVREYRPQYTNTPQTKLEQLKKNYAKKNNYASLKKILELELKDKRFKLLLDDSKMAIERYPMQAFVYYVNGVALNSFRKYKAAIETLETGLEYLIDDKKLEAQFMEQLSLSYKALGQNKKATEYYNKMLNLKGQ